MRSRSKQLQLALCGAGLIVAFALTACGSSGGGGDDTARYDEARWDAATWSP